METKQVSRKMIAAWASWDTAFAACHQVITTFVFTAVYLTDEKLFGVGADQKLGWALSIAGILIALLAPASGQNSDITGRRVFSLRIYTIVVMVAATLLYFVRPGSTGLLIGLILVSVVNVFSELASVNYNALLNDISNEKNVGRISGIGWASGYLGGIVLLGILYAAFIKPGYVPFGLDSSDTPGAIRFSMLLCGIWIAVFSAPLLIMARDDKSNRSKHKHLGLVQTYRHIGKQVKVLWEHDRRTIHFLAASAIFRDGLAGVFTFGGIIAATVFHFSAGEVLIFGVVSNVVAGVFTILFGYIEDHIGPKRVILISLGAMSVAGVVIFLFHSQGKVLFWGAGLALCIFVGPTQSAARTYLSRIAPKEYEGQVFGLYATAGRAVSFLAPFMYSLAITVGASFAHTPENKASYWGILGVVIVLLAGFAMTVTLSGDTSRKVAVHAYENIDQEA